MSNITNSGVELSNKLNAVIGKLSTSLSSPGYSETQKANMIDMLGQLQGAQLSSIGYMAGSNLGTAETIDKAEMANKFLNDAQQLLDDMYTQDGNTLNYLKTAKSTKLKETQFNNYFSQKYNYNIAIMKILVLTSILIMICILLYTRNLMPKFLYVSLVSMIVAITIIVIVTMLISEYRRTNTDFSKFWWFFNPETSLK